MQHIVCSTEDEFKDRYLNIVEKPKKEELSVPIDDFLFGIIEDAVDAEINGREYEMPEDEAFEDEIDKTDIIAVDNYVPRYLNQAITFAIEDIGGEYPQNADVAYCEAAAGIYQRNGQRQDTAHSQRQQQCDRNLSCAPAPQYGGSWCHAAGACCYAVFVRLAVRAGVPYSNNSGLCFNVQNGRSENGGGYEKLPECAWRYE